jgi:hypothetical protein
VSVHEIQQTIYSKLLLCLRHLEMTTSDVSSR